MPPAHPTFTVPFDSGATSFQERAGLPEHVQLAVAHALFRMAAGGMVLDVGAGTGDIGLELVRLGANYVGLDASHQMLELFQRRADAAGLTPRLVHADAREPWPAGDGTVSVIFGSRSLHLLEASHVTREALRVGAPTGARLVEGRILRDEASPRAVLRREMRRRLKAAGPSPRGGGRARGAFIDALEGAGASPLPEAVVAEWETHRTPRDSVEDWRRKPGLAGLSAAEVPPALKDEILSGVLAFAAARFGDVDAALVSVERYSLSGVQLPKTAPGTNR